MDEKKLMSMSLHEHCSFTVESQLGPYLTIPILRVFGGWLYFSSKDNSVFVPEVNKEKERFKGMSEVLDFTQYDLNEVSDFAESIAKKSVERLIFKELIDPKVENFSGSFQRTIKDAVLSTVLDMSEKKGE